MGVVYRGIHPGLDVPVAIKVLADHYSRDDSFRQRFQREAATIASLNHPGIVRVYDFDTDEDRLFIVMELVEGRPLRGWLNEFGRFTVDVSKDLVQQLLSAVGAAHARGVVHRDLKPDNVLISTQGKTKILDFGISKVLTDAAQLTAAGSMVGTPAYMSPEQVNGQDVDARADIYALGCIYYELLHGDPPFTGSMPSVLHAHVFDTPRPSTAIPKHMMEIIWKAMSKESAKRFQSCEEFAGAILSARDEHVSKPPPQAPPPTRVGIRIKLPVLGGGNKDEAPPGGCSHTGCDSREGWQCSYTDPSGNQCHTWWCKQHIVFHEASPFCIRHSSVLKALAATAGTIREIKHRPAVNDRSLPLAALVCEDVDKDLTEVVRRRFQGRKDVSIVVDKHIRQSWEGRSEVAWERAWAAAQANGYLIRIAIRVTAKQPDTVKAIVGNNVVFSAVPDWINRRREGEPPDQGDRARFRAKLLEAVQEHIEQPTAPPRPTQPNYNNHTPAPAPATRINETLLEGMLLRLLINNTKLTAYELAQHVALPFGSVEPTIKVLTASQFVNPLGIAHEPGPWQGRSLPERMSYALTHGGRARADELGNSGTRYVGPAPVSIQEFKAMLTEAAKPVRLEQATVEAALAGLVLAPGVAESIRAAVNSRGSVFIYGFPGNGKTSLARRIVGLLGGPVLIPVALDADGEVIRVFDPGVHQMQGEQPADRRWRRVNRTLVQVGGEFMPDSLDPTWEAGSRTYEAPLQVKANAGVLLIDDLGRQRVAPQAILDRLLVPLEQGVDYMNLSSSGRKIEVPFMTLLALSTNLSPAELLDEAYLRRLAYKIHMPDPTWEAYCKIFEHERAKLGIADAPGVLDYIHSLYSDRPMRGNHPRDLLERLVDVASARGERPQLSKELIAAAWNTIFVAC
jgi:predicted Ser/Thr protein kinase